MSHIWKSSFPAHFPNNNPGSGEMLLIWIMLCCDCCWMCQPITFRRHVYHRIYFVFHHKLQAVILTSYLNRGLWQVCNLNSWLMGNNVYLKNSYMTLKHVYLWSIFFMNHVLLCQYSLTICLMNPKLKKSNLITFKVCIVAQRHGYFTQHTWNHQTLGP